MRLQRHCQTPASREGPMPERDSQHGEAGDRSREREGSHTSQGAHKLRRDFFAGLAEPALIVRTDGQIVDANPAVEEVLGRRVTDLRGRDLRELVARGRRSRLGSLLEHAARRPARWRMGLRGPASRYVQFTGAPIDVPQADMVCLLLRDLSGFLAARRRSRRLSRLLRLAAGRLAVTFWYLDEQGRVLVARGRSLEDETLRPRALRGRSLTEFAADGAALREEIAEARRGNPVDTLVRSRSGRYHLMSLAPLTRAGSTRVVAVSMDVTRRLATERALAKREAQFREIVETTSEGIWIVDAGGATIFANRRMAELLGYSVEELLEMPERQLFDPQWAEIADCSDWRAAELSRACDCALRKRSGELLWVQVRASHFSAPPGIAEARLRLVRDLTEQRQMERAVLEAAESERRRLSAELHDSLGQTLSGLALLSEGLAAEAAERDERLGKQAEEIVRLSREALDTARGLSHHLAPIGHGPDGELASGLKALAERTEEIFGMRCAFQLTGELHPLPAATAEHLYRIAQEAVTNAVRHARPERIGISLEVTHDRLALEIRDDGVGFSEDDDVVSDGIGLRNMRYRARLLGAMVSVRRAEDTGTLVRCILLWPAQAS
ncbi:MAG: PAS domain S-box protein [Candidatus Eisenbacteria bacterium]|nr:PAS domain S-box protein [Candidatus Eisenbacteria bacterium]